MIEDKDEIRRMHEDLLIAEDCIRSLIKETENPFASKSYIEEKAGKAKRCIKFISSFLEE